MKLHKIRFWIFLTAIFLTKTELVRAQGCKDSTLRDKVAQVAKQEGVDEKELLSIIAHESSCHYYVIAWNLPKQPETARSKFFTSLQEAKAFAEEKIATKQYRVDAGIGQINNEANIKPRGWSLEEVLDPKTALYRVAEVLKERGWVHYHSSNPVYAKKWQELALAALGQAFSNDRESSPKLLKGQSPLIAFNSLADLNFQSIENRLFKIEPTLKKSPLLVFSRQVSMPRPSKAANPWVIYGSL